MDNKSSRPFKTGAFCVQEASHDTRILSHPAMTGPRLVTWAELVKTVSMQRSRRRKTKRVPDGQLSLLDLVG